VSDWSFAAVWDGIAREDPGRDAVVCGARRLTFGELADRAGRLAAHLGRAGLGPGDRVAIDMVNRPEYLETFYAAMKLGCVPVNVTVVAVRTSSPGSGAVKSTLTCAPFANALGRTVSRSSAKTTYRLSSVLTMSVLDRSRATVPTTGLSIVDCDVDEG